MFTGLVEETGTVKTVAQTENGLTLTIGANLVMDGLSVDHSVSVNGVCLTVTGRTETSFTADVIHETLSKTTIGTLEQGSTVNLERAVRLSDRLGGHLVQGHVDCVARVARVEHTESWTNIWITIDPHFRKWLIPVGSICVNGVSLTVADVQATEFKVSIIPHTLRVTTLSELQEQSPVNLEFDMIAKYVENMVHGSSNPAGT